MAYYNFINALRVATLKNTWRFSIVKAMTALHETLLINSCLKISKKMGLGFVVNPLELHSLTLICLPKYFPPTITANEDSKAMTPIVRPSGMEASTVKLLVARFPPTSIAVTL